MKKCIAVICLLLLFSQAIPVMHLFVDDDDAVLFVSIDEDKPTETKFKDSKQVKEYIQFSMDIFTQQRRESYISRTDCERLPSPSLQYFTPPPDFIV